MIHYGMTKTAQIAVARGLAESLAGTGITVNSVLPGPTASSPPPDRRPLFKRFATPDEVASMIAYVCSPRASATTGAAFRVDGGVVRAII
jgi:NAD(P)-dependent dehydrogenase (short-subunit alcohol dehydrogenase family)